MDAVMLPAFFTAVAGVVKWVLSDDEVKGAGKVVSTLAGEVLGGRTDALLCKVFGSSLDYFRSLRTKDPALNHDLERATREAYLIATLELVRQAEIRVAMAAPRGTLLQPQQAASLTRLRRAVQTDLRDLANILPEPLADVELFLVDEKLAPAERMRQLNDSLAHKLQADLRRWLPCEAPPPVLDDLLRNGWRIDTRHNKDVQRDWQSLIAIAFIEKLKTQPRLSTVFEAKILAELAVREPAAQATRTFEGFAEYFDRLVVPLQRIEVSLDVIARDVVDIKGSVRETREDLRTLCRDLGPLSRMLAPLARLPRAVQWGLGALVLAGLTASAAQFALPAACRAPGLQMVCAAFGVRGVPTPAEERLWSARATGGCASLRQYLDAYPAGAFAAAAQSLLAGRRVERRERWTSDERRLPLAVRPTLEPFATEAAARADALRRAVAESGEVCGPFSRGEFRLEGAQVLSDEWLCRAVGSGFVCGLDGKALCKVRRRAWLEEERCGR